MTNLRTLPKCIRMCMTIGNLPTSYMESLTYEEQLIWLYKFLEDTVIPVINDNSKAIEELQNLDLQDEVNKKIEEMAKSGELEEIIGKYIENYIIETNEKIKLLENESKVQKTSRVSLQNYINYDGIGDDYTQGSCVGDDGTIYVYKSNTDYNGGSLLVFNDEQLTATINNINFKHGNGLTYLNGKIYSATFDSKKIISYELNTGITLELNPFNNIEEYNKITAISKYDENHLLCLLYNTTQFADSNSNSTTYLLDIRDNSIEEIKITNTDNIRLNYYASQGMCYKDNHMYLLTSYPSMIIDYILIDNKFNVNKTYLIPMKDKLGLLVGEVEDISPTSNGDRYLITSHIIDGPDKYLSCHFLSFESDIEPTYLQYVDTDTDSQNYRQNVYVDNRPNVYSLYEDGSVYHPFKTLRRGIASANNDNYYSRKAVHVRSGGSSYPYTLGTLYNIHNVLIYNRSNFDTLYIDGNTLLVNCDIALLVDNDETTVINGNITLRNSNVNIYPNRIVLNGLVQLEQCSNMKSYYIVQGNTSNTTPFILYSGCSIKAMIQSAATTSSYVYQIFGDAIVISNVEGDKVTLGAGGAQGVYIKVGNKIGV